MNKGKLLLGVFTILFSLGAYAQEYETEVNQNDTSSLVSKKNETIWTRSTLTDHWGGLGRRLKPTGITFRASLTTFTQGMLKGEGPGDKEWKFGSRLMSTALLNTNKMFDWDWQGLFIVGRLDCNIGHSINGYGGTILPVNTALAYPNETDRVGSSVYIVQFLNKAATRKIFVGKLSMLDLTSFSPIRGGEGTKTFQNLASLTSPNGITTPSVFGGFLVSESKKIDYTVALYGANNALGSWNIHDGFKDGLTAYVYIDRPIEIAGLKGKQGIFGVYSNKSMRALDQISKDNLALMNIPEIRGKRFSYGYVFTQNIYQSSDSKNAISIYGQAVISDKTTIPIDWGIVCGIAGYNPLRTKDTWGINFFDYSTLNNLVGLPIAPLVGFAGNLQAEEAGVEAFYDFEVTPWMSLGADFQFIQPGTQKEYASFLGFRTKLIF